MVPKSILSSMKLVSGQGSICFDFDLARKGSWVAMCPDTGSKLIFCNCIWFPDGSFAGFYILLPCHVKCKSDLGPVHTAPFFVQKRREKTPFF